MICVIMTNPGIDKAQLFTAIHGFPFTPPLLRAMFERHKNGGDKQSTSEFELFVQTPVTDIQSSGYVLYTLEAALWAFFSTSTFQEGALKAVNLGDDADTVGAVYGGLSGAWYGIDAIPSEWIEGLQAKGMLDGVVDEVVELVERGGYDEQ